MRDSRGLGENRGDALWDIYIRVPMDGSSLTPGTLQFRLHQAWV